MNKPGSAAKRLFSVRTAVIAAVAVAAVAAVVGFAIYRDQIAPFRTTILVVDGRSFDMRYFLMRVRLAGAEPMTMFETLMQEEVIREVAPDPPYNLRVGEEDIDRFLRDLAQGNGQSSMTNKEFDEWYRQQVDESRLSNAEYRELVKTGLLARRLTEYLAERVPTVAEQVHLHMIIVNTMAQANQARQRLDAGADFGALARAISTDEKVRNSGGDAGWKPRGALGPILARTAFDELPVGRVSEPLSLDAQSIAILLVSEKAPAREIDADSLRLMKAGVLDEWLQKEIPRHKVVIRGFKNAYDTETDAWVRWQLARMKQ